LAGRKDGALDCAIEDRVWLLLDAGTRQAPPFGDPLRLDDVGRGKGRRADRANFTSAHQIAEDRQRLLDVRVWCRAVKVIEVDVVRLEPTKRAFDGACQPTP